MSIKTRLRQWFPYAYNDRAKLETQALITRQLKDGKIDEKEGAELGAYLKEVRGHGEQGRVINNSFRETRGTDAWFGGVSEQLNAGSFVPIAAYSVARAAAGMRDNSLDLYVLGPIRRKVVAEELRLQDEPNPRVPVTVEDVKAALANLDDLYARGVVSNTIKDPRDRTYMEALRELLRGPENLGQMFENWELYFQPEAYALVLARYQQLGGQ